MGKDFMPDSLRNMQPWLTQLKGHINTDGPGLGQSTTQVTADAALVDSVLTPVGDALTKYLAWIQAEGTARTAISENDAALRDMINRYKHAVGWNEGMAAAWEVKTQTSTYNMDTQKPIITVHPRPGTNEIRGKKPGFTSVDILMRIAGTSAWTTIGSKISHFPFLDTTAPQTPGKPEEREYQAIGYVGDKQAGQPSDIVTGIFST
jgi:hypothetical protein